MSEEVYEEEMLMLSEEEYEAAEEEENVMPSDDEVAELSENELTLSLLATSTHPLMEEGQFSLFNDDRVAHTTDVETDVEIDGIILISRFLDAFRIGHFGEAHGYTDGKVVDQYPYLHKLDFIDVYDAEHRSHAKFIPGFNFIDGLGGHLRVIGRLQEDCDLENIEEVLKQPGDIREHFIRHIFLPAVGNMPPFSRTRQNNLAITADAGLLPPYFRIYPEDVQDLGREVDSMATMSSYLYKFFFAFIRLGQQQRLQQPVSLESTNLNLLVADARKLDTACCHFAVNHVHSETALFWDLDGLASILQGRDQHKYPFMGLGEIGNVTVKDPHISFLAAECWPDEHQHSLNFTYAQGYSQYTKPLGRFKPFADHPFLTAILLGQDYVRSKRKQYQNIISCIDDKKDLLAMQECIVLQLQKPVCRFEVVVSSTSLESILSVDTEKLRASMRKYNILVQVPSEDMTRYCTALTNELHAPLELALHQPEVDRTTIGTVLMCETILSLLPSMSTKDAPYQLLKDYCIAPLASGVIARKRRIALTEVAEVDPGTNTLVVPRGLTRAVFLPLENISREAKKEAIRMMKFLKQVKSANRRTLSEKAAEIILAMHIEEMVEAKIIPYPSALKRAGVLNRHGIGVYSIISARQYVKRAFDSRSIPAHSRLSSFLKTATNLTSREAMITALSKEVLKNCTYVPRVAMHQNLYNISLIAFSVVSPKSLHQVNQAVIKGERLTSKECAPFMRGVEMNLIKSFGMKETHAKQLTRLTPELLSVIGALFVHLNLTRERSTLAVLLIAVVEYSKLKGTLPKGFSTRDFQRKYNIQRTAAMSTITTQCH